jgi:hypothetical protein
MSAQVESWIKDYISFPMESPASKPKPLKLEPLTCQFSFEGGANVDPATIVRCGKPAKGRVNVSARDGSKPEHWSPVCGVHARFWRLRKVAVIDIARCLVCESDAVCSVCRRCAPHCHRDHGHRLDVVNPPR